MRILILFISLATVVTAFSSPVRLVLETTIMGSNGTEAKLAIWRDGFHVRQPHGKPPLFISWEKNR
ncbi:MAG: hypothetical protein LBK99_18750 [Opitutaceae bacterium]|nr:hypothetical protein [Opitutaceae bacterium]